MIKQNKQHHNAGSRSTRAHSRTTPGSWRYTVEDIFLTINIPEGVALKKRETRLLKGLFWEGMWKDRDRVVLSSVQRTPSMLGMPTDTGTEDTCWDACRKS